jgi:hypothetical protein
MSPRQKGQPIEQALADLDALVQAHPELRTPEAQVRLMTWLKEQEMTETKQMKQILVMFQICC